MRPCNFGILGCCFIIAIGLSGCTDTPGANDNINVNDNADDIDNTNGNSNGNVNGNDDANDNGSPVGQEQPQAPPHQCNAQNALPTGNVVYPSAGVLVDSANAVFVWRANDSEDPFVRTTIYISDQEAVFENPLFTQQIDLDATAPEHRTHLQLALESGLYYWGIEISDLCLVGSDPETVRSLRRPLNELGVPFDLRTGLGGGQLNPIELICPTADSAAHPLTTFRWFPELSGVRQIQVFVSRFGQQNPFDEPLRVFNVFDISTADGEVPPTCYTMTEQDEPLPGGEDLNWGLRLETGDRDIVDFDLDQQSGQPFTVSANDPPCGALRNPENETLLIQGTPLEWDATDGNCEDALTSTVYFEFLGATLAEAESPQALFDSSIQCEVQPESDPCSINRGRGLSQLNFPACVVAGGEIPFGVWAWGVGVDDGTDRTELPDSGTAEDCVAARNPAQEANGDSSPHRTFILPECELDEDCDDEDVCNGVETCNASFRCQAGTPLDCDDGDVCNGTEICDPAAGCQAGAPLDCDDGDVCNGVETCDLVAGCQAGAPLNCDDGNACTSDGCDPASGCFNTTINCNDGNACTIDNCNAGSGCIYGTVNCDDGNVCTDDSCDPATGCVHTDNTDPCDDDDACTTNDTCAEGTCVGGVPPNCDDDNVCTDDSCDPATGCIYTDNTDPCDDGLFCNGLDTCSEGTCSAHAGDPCADGSECADTCDEVGDDCFGDEGAGCTDDGNVCTDEVCDETGACTHPFNTAPCDDGLFCNGPDTCSGGTCSIHAGDPCAGGSECADTCDEVGDDCFGDEGAGCTDDGNVCTDEVCDETGACTHPPNTAPCDDGNPCTFNDTCDDGECFSDSPGVGDCCVGNGTPGCGDPSCCSSVCTQDPFCCDTTWDCLCADQTAALCPSLICDPVCGDGCCNGEEDTCTCVPDCGSFCGDNCCNGDEDFENCSADCLG